MNNNNPKIEYRVNCFSENVTPQELQEFNTILKKGGFKTEVSSNSVDENGLGLLFDDFVLLIPLITVAIVQFRKLVEAYWKYHKQRNNKGKLVFKHGDKTLTIEFKNDNMPPIEDFLKFFDESEINVQKSTDNNQGDIDA